MRILMITRQTLYTSPGGDTVQIDSTAKYLRKLGLVVDIKLSNEVIDYNNYDLMHFFNIIRPDDILIHIRQTALPFVVSTIYVDYANYERRNRSGVIGLVNKLFSKDQIEYLKVIARRVKNGDKINSWYYILRGQRKSIRYIAQKASVLLPNSNSEYNRLKKDYGIKTPYIAIPNAIDVSFFDAETTQANTAFTDHVLCVGRIEGRKNQLALVRALNDTDIKLTLIGKPSPNHMSYYHQCKEITDQNPNMQIIEHIDHKGLAGIYKAAKVHILPSWFETTGLSSLEAGVMGCNVIVTREGDTEEYFKDMAWYAEADDESSIKASVLEAFNAKVDGKLKEHILQNYTWDKAAEKTYKGYKLALQKTTK